MGIGFILPVNIGHGIATGRCLYDNQQTYMVQPSREQGSALYIGAGHSILVPERKIAEKEEVMERSVIDSISVSLRKVTACIWLLLLFVSMPVLSATSLMSTATDGKKYTTSFGVSVTSANSTAELTSVNVDQPVKIAGTITPDPQHANKLADIFAVERMNGQFYMLTLTGVFEPWNGQIATLKPMREAANLGSSLTLEIYNGTFSNAAKHEVFIGYVLLGGSALIYTPLPANFETKAEEISISPLTYFTDKIEASLIQSRCIVCHVAGGVAKDSAMILERSNSASAYNNFNSLKALQAGRGSDYILQKVSGSIAHTGGVQINAGGEDYAAMATMLGLLGGTATVTVPANDFFTGVTLQTRPETLRRAAIMLASRAPTQQELDAVANGDENTLRTALKSLLTGAGFHRFLTEGANDRLLTEGVQFEVIPANFAEWTDFTNYLYEIRKAGRDAGQPREEYRAKADSYGRMVNDGARSSVGELVAYVVENDKPYTEVLTADYMMMTPSMNLVLGGGATFKNPGNSWEFQPGRITNYYVRDEYLRGESDVDLEGRYVVPSRSRINWPHAGILNNPAFLNRYPTTPTNRNRARARWTMLNFLDIDIEKSTQRPTDPVALADKNNPTMKNPACYACHEHLDPVAAAFQIYGDRGFYLADRTDSLDQFYKHPADGSATPYQPGDLWYRDMRAAGLFGQAIDAKTEPLKQLAALIVKDAAFARATVKFWWPSVMNSDVLLAPVVTTDSDYQSRLTAYQSQAAAIEQFARDFRKDYNLKNLLVNMMMSPWFRAKSTSRTDKLGAYEVADVGVKKLLTPERLNRKTAALTGFSWGRPLVSPTVKVVPSSLDGTYNVFYGGIDSFNVTRRTRDMTPVMNSVAQANALQSACPIIMREFALPDVKRLLFGGMTEMMTPLYQGSMESDVTSKGSRDWQVFTLNVDLQHGPVLLEAGMTNPWCDFDSVSGKCRSQRAIYIDRFEVKLPGATAFTPLEFTATDIRNFKRNCFPSGTSDAYSGTDCMPGLTYQAPVSGYYQIRLVIAADQAGSEAVHVNFVVEDANFPLVSTSLGAVRIKQKLVELHSKLLGRNYSIDSPEIAEIYDLYVKSWLEKTQSNAPKTLSGMCNWAMDANFFDDLGIEGTLFTPLKQYAGLSEWNRSVTDPFINRINHDYMNAKQAWVSVIAYMLSDFDYLYE